jgi:hypothetical protein
MKSAWEAACAILQHGSRVKVTVEEAKPSRSLDQNALLWSLLTDISRQVDWYGQKLSAEDYKHIFTSSLRGLRVVPNLDGTGFVALGLSTSRMKVGEFSELLELIYAFGAEKGVAWTNDQAGAP